MGNSATNGPDAYYMKLTEENKLGEGTYGAVYKITTKNKPQRVCAAKIFKIPLKMMDDLDQLGYDRELKILQESSHPFVIKYMEEFVH
jgi:serine/threonine protein kinase